MPTITALLHTNNDALRLGRALEMLFPCDHLLIVDHASTDATAEVAREYGARVVPAKRAVSYSDMVASDWILSIDPHESVTEALTASLFEWKSEHIPPAVGAFSVFRREETVDGWIQNPAAHTRLVRTGWSRWQGHFPASEPSAIALEGDLLHFIFP